jgi:hypothetical protein
MGRPLKLTPESELRRHRSSGSYGLFTAGKGMPYADPRLRKRQILSAARGEIYILLQVARKDRDFRNWPFATYASWPLLKQDRKPDAPMTLNALAAELRGEGNPLHVVPSTGAPAQDN